MLGSLIDRKTAPYTENDQYICPEGQELKQFRRNYSDPN